MPVLSNWSWSLISSPVNFGDSRLIHIHSRDARVTSSRRSSFIMSVPICPAHHWLACWNECAEYFIRPRTSCREGDTFVPPTLHGLSIVPSSNQFTSWHSSTPICLWYVCGQPRPSLRACSSYDLVAASFFARLCINATPSLPLAFAARTFPEAVRLAREPDVSIMIEGNGCN